MSGYRNYNYDDDDDDLEEQHENYEVHQAIVFAIHLTPTMYKYLPQILNNLVELIRNLAKSLPNTGIGCYFFNCSAIVVKPENSIAITKGEGIYKLLPLADINAEQFKTLHDLVNSEVKDETTCQPSNNLYERLPLLSEEPISNYSNQLNSLLTTCVSDFNGASPKQYTSGKVFLFTDCDKPFNNSEKSKNAIQGTVRDLNDLKITLVPFFLPKDDSTKFNSDEFNILLGVGLQGDDLIDNSSSERYKPSADQVSLDNIKEKISRGAEIKRKSFNCPLEFQGIYMSVNGYSMFKSLELRSAHKYYEDNGLHYVQTKTTKMAKLTGEEMTNENIKKVIEVGDQKLFVKKELLDMINKYNEKEKPILRILGFRKLEYFHPSYTIGTPTFMVPDEDGEYTHSARTFSTLYQSMIRTKRMAVVWGMPTKSKAPTMYYLVPADPSLGYKTSVNHYPHGMALIPLPYKDNIRGLPDYFVKQNLPLPEIIPNQFGTIVSLLSSEYGFQAFQNPKIDWSFKVYEDSILQTEVENSEGWPEQYRKQVELNKIDQLKVEGMKLRNIIQSDDYLSECFESFNKELLRLSNTEKVSTVKDTKKAKKDITDQDVKVAIRTGKLSKYTMTQLTKYINGKPNLIAKGKKKDDMIANIEDYARRMKMV